MKKLKNKINGDDNKVTNVILNLIDGTLEGDGGDYSEGEIVKYEYDLNDEDYVEMIEDEDVNKDDIKKVVGEGICLIVDEDIWYNVIMNNDVMVVEYKWVEIY